MTETLTREHLTATGQAASSLTFDAARLDKAVSAAARRNVGNDSADRPVTRAKIAGLIFGSGLAQHLATSQDAGDVDAVQGALVQWALGDMNLGLLRGGASLTEMAGEHVARSSTQAPAPRPSGTAAVRPLTSAWLEDVAPDATTSESVTSAQMSLSGQAFLAVADSYADGARRLHGLAVKYVGAAALVRAYGIKAPTRPHDPATRRRLLDALAVDPLAAHRAAEVAAGVSTTPAGQVDDVLVDLWRSSSTDLEVIAETEPHVAHLLAFTAAEVRPRPMAPTLTRLQMMVRSLATTSGWRTVADELVDAYIATEFEATCEAARLSGDRLASTLAKHEIDAAAWSERARAAVVFPGAPMGSSMREIRGRLDGFSVAVGAINLDVLNGTSGQIPSWNGLPSVR